MPRTTRRIGLTPARAGRAVGTAVRGRGTRLAVGTNPDAGIERGLASGMYLRGRRLIRRGVMKDQNEQGQKANNAKKGTTREQDQETGRDQKDVAGQAAGTQVTRDKGRVPVRDDDPTEDQLGETR
jgi:hypothetical protein